MFDRFSRGRYATDASLYQMMSLGVLSAKSEGDIRAAIEVARAQGVELVDATMIALARDIPLFRDRIEAFVTGRPDALLLVEFSEEHTSTHHPKAARP